MKLRDKNEKKAWAMTIYGVSGVGKSTLATHAPKPVFLNCEDGLDRIDCDTGEQLDTWQKLYEAMIWATKTDYETVVFDGLFAIQERLVERVLSDTSESSGRQVLTLDDKKAFPFGSGQRLLEAQWVYFCEIIKKFKTLGKNVLILGHHDIIREKNPEGEDYPRYSLNMHQKSVEFFVSKMDAVLFAEFEKMLVSKNENTDQKIALGTGKRVLQTSEMPHCLAKNRFGLPKKVSFSIDKETKAFWQLIK